MVMAEPKVHSVIVTIRRGGDDGDRDVEVPNDVPVEAWSSLLAQALNWHRDARGRVVRYRIQVPARQAAIDLEQSLADAGIWDGATLLFEAEEAADGDDPVTAWRPLGIPLPGNSP